MRPRALIPLLSFVCCVAAVRTSEAGCPTRQTCSMAPCLVVCPEGDTDFLVTTSFFGTPMQGASVVLDFSACPGFRLSPRNGTEAYWADSSGRHIWRYSDYGGNALFHVRGSGGSGGTVTISTCNSIGPGGPGQGIILGTRTLASLDRDGDAIVNSTDMAAEMSRVGTADPGADFDCDGGVTSADAAIVAAHLGHAGDFAVPTKPTSWGTLKILYR